VQKKRVAVIEAVASPQQRPPKSEPQDMAPRRGKGSPDSAKPQQTSEKEPQPKSKESPSKDKGIDTEFVAKIEVRTCPPRALCVLSCAWGSETYSAIIGIA